MNPEPQHILEFSYSPRRTWGHRHVGPEVWGMKNAVLLGLLYLKAMAFMYGNVCYGFRRNTTAMGLLKPSTKGRNEISDHTVDVEPNNMSSQIAAFTILDEVFVQEEVKQEKTCEKDPKPHSHGPTSQSCCAREIERIHECKC